MGAWKGVLAAVCRLEGIGRDWWIGKGKLARSTLREVGGYNLSHGEEEKTVAKKAKLEAELAKLK